MNLREKAAHEAATNKVRAEEYERAEAEKRTEKGRKDVRDLLTKRFGVDESEISFESGDSSIAIVDGLRFIGRKWYDSYGGGEALRLLGVCPDCQDEVPSHDIFDLADLAGKLESFFADNHDCLERQVEKGLAKPRERTPQVEPTRGEQLYLLIREIIREEMPAVY